MRFCIAKMKKQLRFSSNQTAVLKMVSKCVTYEWLHGLKKMGPIVPDILIAYHTWILPPCNGILRINTGFSAEQYLFSCEHMYQVRWNPVSSPNKSVGVNFSGLRPQQAPVHKIQFCFMTCIFMFVSQLSYVLANAMVLLHYSHLHQVKPKTFFNISILTPISPRFCPDWMCLLHVLCLKWYLLFKTFSQIHKLFSWHIRKLSSEFRKMLLIQTPFTVTYHKNAYFHNVIFNLTADKSQRPHNFSNSAPWEWAGDWAWCIS
jgi:hypothetical protein